ncbi:hypothetical protein Godav_002395, partial [Gossypium davidsonii]|nr:hypothetical protein [Gossypium davidsonii]
FNWFEPTLEVFCGTRIVKKIVWLKAKNNECSLSRKHIMISVKVQRRSIDRSGHSFFAFANPRLEPPIMVISIVLFVMAYDYPPKKIRGNEDNGGGKSDDGGEEGQ